MIELYCGDCLEVMASMPSQSVQAIITDLPYGTTQNKWDVVIPFAPLWEQVRRVLMSNGVFVTTASQPFTSQLILSNADWFKYADVWDKRNTRGHLNAKKMPLRRHEDVVVFANGKAVYHPQMRTGKTRKKGGSKKNSGCYGDYTIVESINDRYYPTSIIEIYSEQVGKVHPTQKPVALYEYLVKTYSNEGDTVLDPCMGSGTTGVACVNLGRNFIGIESDTAYYQRAANRIEENLRALNSWEGK